MRADPRVREVYLGERLSSQRLSAGYGRAQILFDFALEIDAGEVVALLGRNGAGKSTTLKTIMGLLPARAGRGAASTAGASTRLQPYEIARLGLGYVPEDRRIFTDLTVAGKPGSRPPAAAAVAPRPGREERLLALFPALAGMRGVAPALMSGGEQQMLTHRAHPRSGNPEALAAGRALRGGLAPRIAGRNRAVGDSSR